MEQIELREAGLLLRPWRPHDARAVYLACQDPEIQRWTTVPSPYRLEHAEHFVASQTEKAWAEGTAAPFGVFDPKTDELLGSSGFVSLRADLGEAEIGYWVAPWARGHSVATRAGRAIARWGLQRLGLARIVWQAEVGNFASRAVAEQLGVHVEGTLRAGLPAGNRRVNSWLGALVRGDLREADQPLPTRRSLQLRTFGSPQPTIVAAAPSGDPVSLRPPDRPDIAAIVTACRDPETVRWTTVPDPYQESDALTFVDSYAPGQWLRGEGATFAIADPAGAYAGSMSLRLTGPDTGEVGFVVAPEARGRGYASTALGALVDWAYHDLALHRVEWRAYVGNDASRAVAERAGFTMEGIARAACVQRGQYRDAWTAARLSTDRPDLNH